MKNENEQFELERKKNIELIGNDPGLIESGFKFVESTAPYKYTYNFSWLGRPIIQFPQDIVALQEIIWETKPDLIIETGIAHGGSLILSASILELIGNGEVLGIDIDIRDHNRAAIQDHPLYKRISMIQGSSIDAGVVDQVKSIAGGKEKIMVILDSNHTFDHVYAELQAYANMVTKGCYLVVLDTSVEFMPEDFNWNGRPWSKGNNPHTAVMKYLKENTSFEIDKSIQNKLLITVAPDGYLKRIR